MELPDGNYQTYENDPTKTARALRKGRPVGT